MGRVKNILELTFNETFDSHDLGSILSTKALTANNAQILRMETTRMSIKETHYVAFKEKLNRE